MVAWSHVARTFPYGQFLSDGAYKSVYRVWAADEGRVRACVCALCVYVVGWLVGLVR